MAKFSAEEKNGRKWEKNCGIFMVVNL